MSSHSTSRDPKYLLDMLLAAEDARSFASSLSRDDLDQSRLHQYAIVRVIEIIGEAGRMVSPQTKDAHPEIPWRLIVNMRHRLVHDYGNVDLDIVWDVIQNDLPPLIEQLRALAPEP